jgi:hypothetical protein
MIWSDMCDVVFKIDGDEDNNGFLHDLLPTPQWQQIDKMGG